MRRGADAWLAAFLGVLSLHLGQSTGFGAVTWLGGLTTFLAWTRWVRVERPTWGLVFVLLATGALAGNQILEDWALEGTWPQTNGFGAGLVLSLQAWLIWLFAARDGGPLTTLVAADQRTIVVLGLVLLLLMAPPETTVVQVAGVAVPGLALLGLLLATVVRAAELEPAAFRLRLLLLLPLALMVPLTFVMLARAQDPILGGMASLLPPPGEYTPTGFSPFQQLRANAFLRPSNRPVLRIEADRPPDPYLVGNRLVLLDEQLIWRAEERPQQSLTLVDAVAQDNGLLRYTLGNHHVPVADVPAEMAVTQLTSNSFMFVSPTTDAVAGPFTAMTRSAADVWFLTYERGSDRRWTLFNDAPATPDPDAAAALQLPPFWDAQLQARSAGFLAPSRAETVANVVSHFQRRPYSLQTDFDPQQPFHDFFLNDQAAYCFWFATGATLALRANGIPARLVGGYRINERLEENLWLVRERDAHSWVEWQDTDGFWHTVDPTPVSIFGFFDGYSASASSQFYHRLAAQWQRLIDTILADATLAASVRYGGLLILVFLFVREYRRLRRVNLSEDARRQRWERLWNRFLRTTRLPAQPDWTTATYAAQLPVDWPATRRDAVRAFLQAYEQARFGAPGQADLAALESRLRHLGSA